MDSNLVINTDTKKGGADRNHDCFLSESLEFMFMIFISGLLTFVAWNAVTIWGIKGHLSTRLVSYDIT